jgi:hypothetical protein
MDNCNKDITTRVYKKEDLYDGMFIQSFGNKDYIYKITINDDKYYYSTAHRIGRLSCQTPDGKFIEECSGSSSVNNGANHFINYFKEDSDGYINWCETFWTRKLNKDTKREDILIELGI